MNRIGRRTLVCMAALALVAVAMSLAGCLQSIGTVNDGMKALKGQPIGAAIAKLGLPDEEATIAGTKTYTWRTSTVAGGDQYQCRIRVVMAGNVIGSYEGSGDLGSCERYAAKLRS